MSLLSRFRKTVIPSSYRNKKSTDASDVHQHNYRKPTKSFNEKSVKSRSSTQSFTNSYDDDDLVQQSKHKSVSRNSSTKPSKLSTIGSLAKSAKNRASHGDAADAGTLSRSDTFTLEEENQIQNGTYPRLKRKDNYTDTYRASTNKGKTNKNHLPI